MTQHMDYASLDAETLAKHIQYCQDMEADCRDRRQRCEHELIRRMEAESAREWVFGPRVVSLTPAPPEYDPDKLRAKLGEVLTPEELEQAWIPEATKVVPGKFHAGRLATLARKRGKPVLEALDAARLPARPPKLTVETKL